jgi:hypothetical protein
MFAIITSRLRATLTYLLFVGCFAGGTAALLSWMLSANGTPATDPRSITGLAIIIGSVVGSHAWAVCGSIREAPPLPKALRVFAKIVTHFQSAISVMTICALLFVYGPPISQITLWVSAIVSGWMTAVAFPIRRHRIAFTKFAAERQKIAVELKTAIEDVLTRPVAGYTPEGIGHIYAPFYAPIAAIATVGYLPEWERRVWRGAMIQTERLVPNLSHEVPALKLIMETCERFTSLDMKSTENDKLMLESCIERLKVA